MWFYGSWNEFKMASDLLKEASKGKDAVLESLCCCVLKSFGQNLLLWLHPYVALFLLRFACIYVHFVGPQEPRNYKIFSDNSCI